MSATIVSYVIAGCEITGELHRDVTSRGCEHPVTDLNFCPQCGKPMFQTVRQAIAGYDGEGLVIDGKRWEIVSDAGERRFIGVVLAKVNTWPEKVARVEQIDAALLGELRAALTSVELWDPDSYAIWHVLYVS